MLVDEHCEAIENDLSRYHGKRLRDLFTGDMSWRELETYLERLPPESAYRTEVRDAYTDEELAEFAGRDEGKHGPWSRLELLVASLNNELRQLTYVQLMANGAKNVTKPEPMRTPGVSGKPFRKAADPRARAYLQDIVDRHAREAGVT